MSGNPHAYDGAARRIDPFQTLDRLKQPWDAKHVFEALPQLKIHLELLLEEEAVWLDEETARTDTASRRLARVSGIRSALEKAEKKIRYFDYLTTTRAILTEDETTKCFQECLAQLPSLTRLGNPHAEVLGKYMHGAMEAQDEVKTLTGKLTDMSTELREEKARRRREAQGLCLKLTALANHSNSIGALVDGIITDRTAVPATASKRAKPSLWDGTDHETDLRSIRSRNYLGNETLNNYGREIDRQYLWSLSLA